MVYRLSISSALNRLGAAPQIIVKKNTVERDVIYFIFDSSLNFPRMKKGIANIMVACNPETVSICMAPDFV